MQPSKGGVVLLDFPFSDSKGKKVRPALVLVVRLLEITVAFISSQAHRAEADDLLFSPAAHSGFSKPSFLRVSKVATLDYGQIHYNLGRFTVNEMRSIDETMRRVYQL